MINSQKTFFENLQFFPQKKINKIFTLFIHRKITGNFKSEMTKFYVHEKEIKQKKNTQDVGKGGGTKKGRESIRGGRFLYKSELNSVLSTINFYFF